MEPVLMGKALLGKIGLIRGPAQPALDKNNIPKAKILYMILNIILQAYVFCVIVKSVYF